MRLLFIIFIALFTASCHYIKEVDSKYECKDLYKGIPLTDLIIILENNVTVDLMKKSKINTTLPAGKYRPTNQAGNCNYVFFEAPGLLEIKTKSFGKLSTSTYLGGIGMKIIDSKEELEFWFFEPAQNRGYNIYHFLNDFNYNIIPKYKK